MTDIVSVERSPRVSIVVPSRDGNRGGCVARLMQSIDTQTFTDHEVILITGVTPQGKAINRGARKARGEILLIIDDDSRLADQDVLARLVAVLDSQKAIGMVGASVTPPPEATTFQLRAARQLPRFNTPVAAEVTDSDMACHGCCAIPMDVFNDVGREREDIYRGLDPDLRERLRKKGYRVVLAPNAVVYHPVPDGWRRLLKVFFRNGFGSAYAFKFARDSVYETHESANSGTFQPRRNFAYRTARFPLRLVRALATGEIIRFAAYCAYGSGYLWGLIGAREMKVNERGS